jgi:hypothetical protein
MGGDFMTREERSYILGKIFARMDIERGKKDVEREFQKAVSGSIEPHSEEKKIMVGGVDKQ